MTERNVDHGFQATPVMARMLDEVAATRRLVLAVEVPSTLVRIRLHSALDDQIGRWGRRACDLSAFIDLSNHHALAAQTVIGSKAQTWDDLADGLPEAMAAANILILLGAEQMLSDTPNRFAAFLEARARHQVVIVITPHAVRVCQLAIRDTPVHLDQSLSTEFDLQIVTKSVSRTAIAAARRATRRQDTVPRASFGEARPA